MTRLPVAVTVPVMFQCSSASRKFLNHPARRRDLVYENGFSALQRAENSSMPSRRISTRWDGARFQCSSASRKFLNLARMLVEAALVRVSVLFSEPKIPQLFPVQAALLCCSHFQCSSASRKFLNPDPRTCVHPYFRPR